MQQIVKQIKQQTSKHFAKTTEKDNGQLQSNYAKRIRFHTKEGHYNCIVIKCKLIKTNNKNLLHLDIITCCMQLQQ